MDMWKHRIKAYWHLLVIALVILLLVIFRVTSYGDPTLSIGTNDSSSYFAQVDVPTFSWKALTVRRLPSYVLFFKMFEPEEGYELKAVNYPAAPGRGTSEKIFQKGFDGVVVSQMLLSIAAWVFFAITVERRLQNRFLKILAVGVTLLFGFLPPIAEWDSIIMSESGSFSLFMIMLGISLEIINRILKEGTNMSKGTGVWGLFWFVVLLLWAFMRDSNANLLIVMALLFGVLLAIPATRRRLPVKPLVGMTVILLAIFIMYAVAAGQSGRWMGSWRDLKFGYIDPYPEHVKFFQDHGMPYHETDKWAAENGAKTYLLMLMNFPRFTLNIFVFQLQDIFSENLQPFFFTPNSTGYRTMIALGNIFHPLSSLVFLFGLLSSGLVTAAAFRKKNCVRQIWGWMAIWMVLLVYCYFGFTFYGDSAGLIRHLLGASMPMRLMVWLFPIVLADFSLEDGMDGTQNEGIGTNVET